MVPHNIIMYACSAAGNTLAVVVVVVVVVGRLMEGVFSVEIGRPCMRLQNV